MKTPQVPPLEGMTPLGRSSQPEPIAQCPSCGARVSWTNDDWRSYQLAMTVDGISPSREPDAYAAMFQAFLDRLASEHCDRKPTVKTRTLDGQDVDTFRTEAEHAGIQETQGGLPL